jgi:hypothetical protein
MKLVMQFRRSRVGCSLLGPNDLIKNVKLQPMKNNGYNYKYMHT